MLITKFTGFINFVFELGKVIIAGAGIYYLTFVMVWWMFGVTFLGISFLAGAYVKLVVFLTLVAYLTWAAWAAYKAITNPNSRYNIWRRAYEARKAPKHLK
jgi:membrane protein implicated in regulation of membrane protease activity